MIFVIWYHHNHVPQLPDASYVPATSTVTFLNGEREQILNFPIGVNAFLSFGAVFNISISSATLINPLGTTHRFNSYCVSM